MAADGRGLVSAPATVTVSVAAPLVVGPAGLRRLLLIGRVQRRAPRRLAVRLHCRPSAATVCSGVHEARIRGRRVGRVRFAGFVAGRRRTVAVRLRRSAVGRRVVLRAVVRDVVGQGVVARRVVRPR